MYKGQAMPMYEDKFKTVPAGYSLTFDVSFMMEKPPKDLNNMYLYMIWTVKLIHLLIHIGNLII